MIDFSKKETIYYETSDGYNEALYEPIFIYYPDTTKPVWYRSILAFSDYLCCDAGTMFQSIKNFGHYKRYRIVFENEHAYERHNIRQFHPDEIKYRKKTGGRKVPETKKRFSYILTIKDEVYTLRTIEQCKALIVHYKLPIAKTVVSRAILKMTTGEKKYLMDNVSVEIVKN